MCWQDCARFLARRLSFSLSGQGSEDEALAPQHSLKKLNLLADFQILAITPCQANFANLFEVVSFTGGGMRASSPFMLATKTQSLQRGVPLLSTEPRYFDELTSQTCALAATEHPPYQPCADASCVLYLPWRGDSLANFDGVDASYEEYVRRNTLAGRTTDNEKLQGFVGFGSASQAAAVAFYKNNGQEGRFARIVLRLADMRAVTLRMTVQSVFPHYRLTRTQPLLEILQRPCTTFVTLVAVVEPMQAAVPVSQQLIARRPIAAKCMLHSLID